MLIRVWDLSTSNHVTLEYPVEGQYSIQQEIRSVEHGYLSHCFKSTTRDLGHAPFGVAIIVPYVVLAMAYPTKKKRRV